MAEAEVRDEKTVTIELADPSQKELAAKELAKLQERSKKDAAQSFKYATHNRFLTTTILSWKRTILPDVFYKADVYVAVIFHVVLFVIDQSYRSGAFGLGESCSTSTTSVAGINGSTTSTKCTANGSNGSYFVNWNVTTGNMGQCIWLMVFSLTFFTGQCYGRYNGFYGNCGGMGGKLMEIAQKLAVDLETQAEARWDVIRYLSCSIMLVYGDTQRGKGPAAVHKELFWKRLMEPESNFVGHEVKFEGMEVKCPPLLTSQEVAVLKAHNGNRGMLLQTWALKAASIAYENIGVSRSFLPIREDVHQIRRSGAGILNALALPVPFPYYHILLIIQVFNYFLFSFAFLNMNSYFSPILMLMVCMMFSGIRELASELADPFGDDEQDLPVMKFMTAVRASVSPIVQETTWYPNAPKPETNDIKKVAMACLPQDKL